jgi:hypothetical protein
VLPTPGPGLVSAGEVEAPPDRNGRELGRTKHDGLVRRAAGSAPSRFMSEQPVHGRGSPSLLVAAGIQETTMSPTRASPRLAGVPDQHVMEKAKKRAAWKNLDNGGNDTLTR